MKTTLLLLFAILGFDAVMFPAVAGLSFRRADKDLNGIPEEDDDLQFQMNLLPKARRQVDDKPEAIEEVKDNALPASKVEDAEPKQNEDSDKKTPQAQELVGKEETTPKPESVKPKEEVLPNSAPSATESPKREEATNEESEHVKPNADQDDDDENDSLEDMDKNVGTEPTIFALANTDVGRSWEGIPFRERYIRGSHDALCHPFDLSIPNRKGDQGTLSLCLYRTEIATHHPAQFLVSSAVENLPKKHGNVYGFVKSHPKSKVEGVLVQGRFYGHVFLGENKNPSTYVVEDVQALAKLMEHSDKLLRDLLMVMNSGKGQKSDSEPKLNAIVTTGISLESFSSDQLMTSDKESKPSFLSLSTGHNSFIISGDPKMSFDEKGRTLFTVGQEVIAIGLDKTVSLKIKSHDLEYKFRPNGQSILLEGLNVTNLEGQEGPVAVFAVSETLDYGCVIPSPAFSNVRKGGYLCKICAGLDESFRDKFIFPKTDSNSDVYEFVSEMLDRVTWIFRSIDWNHDGKFDDIGITYDPQVFGRDFSDFGNNLSTEELETFYENLVKSDFSDCCLGIMYTMKQFPGDFYAKSSLATPGLETGICSFKREADGIWNNVILISGNKKDSSAIQTGNLTSDLDPMTPDQLLYLTAHEIGKAFGGSLDATGNAKCDSFKDSNGTQRHFLLWPDVVRSITVEEKAFSSCSLENIYTQLDSCRSSCFEISNEPFCGNGIVEMGEECDCGSEIQCLKNPCCYPRNGKYPCQNTGHACNGTKSGSTVTVPIGVLVLFSFLTTKQFMF